MGRVEIEGSANEQEGKMAKEVGGDLTWAQKAKIKTATGKDVSEIKVSSPEKNVAASPGQDSLRSGDVETMRAGEEDSLRGDEIETMRAGDEDSLRGDEIDSMRAGDEDSLRGGDEDSTRAGGADGRVCGELPRF